MLCICRPYKHAECMEMNLQKVFKKVCALYYEFQLLLCGLVFLRGYTDYTRQQCLNESNQNEMCINSTAGNSIKRHNKNPFYNSSCDFIFKCF